MHRRRQGVQSTTNTSDALKSELEGPEIINVDRTQRVGIHLVTIQDLNGMISVDQTGKFPILSQQGHRYIMILYNYDTNGILATGVQSRKAIDLIDAYESLYQ